MDFFGTKLTSNLLIPLSTLSTEFIIFSLFVINSFKYSAEKIFSKKICFFFK